MKSSNALNQIDIIDYPILKQLTGFDSPSKQADCLFRHNIFFLTGKDGKVITTSKWLEQASFSGQFSANDEVNLDF